MLHVELFKPRTVLGNSILNIELEVETHLGIHGHLIQSKGKPVFLAAGDVVFKVSGGVVRQTGVPLLPAGTALVILLGHKDAVIVSLLAIRTGEVHPSQSVGSSGDNIAVT